MGRDLNKTVLITGIEGFTGRYVAAELERCGYKVHGVTRTGDPGEALSVCDLNIREDVMEIVSAVRPNAVVHLAGISHVAHADVSEIYLSNIMGTRNLLEALAAQPEGIELVLIPSSAHVYGNAPVGMLDEQSPLLPHNDYAVSKLAVEHVARLWMDRLPIAVTRPFNYTGRGQSEAFLVPKIVGFARRRDAALKLGNLDVARDFSDVRDLAAVYARILGARPAGRVLNVCTGTAVELNDIVSMVSELSGVAFQVDSDAQLRRDHEVRRLSGSNTALLQVIGPYTFRPIRETLEWMLGD